MVQSCKPHVIQLFPFAPVPLVLRTTGGVFGCPLICFFLCKTCCFLLWLPLWPCPNCVIRSPSSAFLARGMQGYWISSDLVRVLLPHFLSRSFETGSGVVLVLAVLPLPAVAGGNDSAGSTAVAVGSKWRNEGHGENKAFLQNSWSSETFSGMKHLLSYFAQELHQQQFIASLAKWLGKNFGEIQCYYWNKFMWIVFNMCDFWIVLEFYLMINPNLSSALSGAEFYTE